MKKKLMNGNEALAEAAIRAGCSFYAGYPITPQSEILEYMSWRMKEVGGSFYQAESELASINMVLGAASAGARAMTSSSGPGFSLYQEGISYLISGDIPAVIVDVARFGSGIGEISQGQCDYKLVRSNGHGDSNVIILAPSSVQECVDLMGVSFGLAEKYRHPVIILADAAIGQMIEPIVLPDYYKHNIDRYEWTVKGCKGNDESKKITNVFYYMDDYNTFLREKYRTINKEEQRWKSILTEDSDLILVAYGISSRICKEAIVLAREEGIKLGMIQLISLYPFPVNAFKELRNDIKAIMSIEMSITGQLSSDIKVATECKYPVFTFGTGIKVPTSDDIVNRAKGILDNTIKEEVFS